MDRSRKANRLARRAVILLALVVSACGTAQLPAPPPSGSGGIGAVDPSASLARSLPASTPTTTGSGPTDTAGPTPSPAPTASPEPTTDPEASPSAEPAASPDASPSAEPSPSTDQPGDTGQPATPGVAGTDWLATAADPHLRDLATTPRGLLAVGQDRRGGVVWLSSDGKSWVVDDDGPAFDSASLWAAAANSTLEVAIGCQLHEGRCVAPVVWIRHGRWHRTRALPGSRGTTLIDVAASDGHIVVVGRVAHHPAVWTSTDGLAWHLIAKVPHARHTDIRALATGGPGFVAVGVVGGRPMSWVSPDGQAWTPGGPQVPQGELTDVTASAGTLYASGSVPAPPEVGDVIPTVWSSTDGLTWTGLGTIDATGRLGSVAAGPSGISALQDGGGTAYFSTDGKAWTAADMTTTGAESIVGQPVGFLAVGDASVWTSPRIAPALPLDPLLNLSGSHDWAHLKPMPLLAPGATGAAGDGGGIYLFSDADGRGTMRVDRYDPGRDRWMRRPSASMAIRDPHAVAAARGLIYLVGVTLDGRHGRLIAYDSKSGRWRVLAPVPTARLHPAVAIGSDRAIYVFGGIRSPCCAGVVGDGSLRTVERYDPGTGRWTRRSPMPVADAHPGAAASGRGMYVFLAARAWHYDLRRDRWRAGATNLSYGVTGEATVGNDGLIRVFTCTRYDLFDPAMHHWQPGRELGTPRCDPVVVNDASAQIYVFGGTYTGDPGRVLESVDSGGG